MATARSCAPACRMPLHFWTRDQGNLPDLETLEASAAKFDLDLKKPLDQRMAKLDALNVTFHAKLGKQGERVAPYPRSRRPARADQIGADPALVDRAAVLAKADLRTEAVGEFPELQGLMGRRYALLQGEDACRSKRRSKITGSRTVPPRPPAGGQGRPDGGARRQA